MVNNVNQKICTPFDQSVGNFYYYLYAHPAAANLNLKQYFSHIAQGIVIDTLPYREDSEQWHVLSLIRDEVDDQVLELMNDSSD